MDEFEAAARGLLGGGVGGAQVQPYFPGVGGAQVQPYYPGVGAPAVMAQAPQRPIQYSPEQYNNGEVSYLGFGVTSVPAGSAGLEIEINTKRPFNPQQFRIPSTVVGLLINEVNIEGTNLLANAAGVPVELFSEVSTTPPIDWFTINPATGATLVVANPTGSAIDFKGALWGVALRK